MTTAAPYGVPSAAELRAALAALGVSVDDDRLGVGEMPPERQVTVLLGVLSSWVTTFQYVQATMADPIGLADLAAVVAASEAEATGGNEVAVLSCALWRTQWAALTVARFEHDPSPASPARITTHLLEAAGAMLSTWSTAQSDNGIDLGVDGQFTAVDAGLAHVAVDHTLAAADGLDALLGPTEH